MFKRCSQLGHSRTLQCLSSSAKVCFDTDSYSNTDHQSQNTVSPNTDHCRKIPKKAVCHSRTETHLHGLVILQRAYQYSSPRQQQKDPYRSFRSVRAFCQVRNGSTELYNFQEFPFSLPVTSSKVC